MTTLKKQSETGGLSLFVDTRSVVDELKLCNNSLYTLITRPDFSSFRADNKSFEPQPIYNESTGIFRYRFDDGIQMSASLVEQLPKLKSIFYKHAFVVKLQPGQCYIADNHRLLHGRTSFTGTRELLRVLAYPRSIQPKKFILFDVDGTLCRAEALSIDAYYRCVTDVSGREITHENTKVNLHGQTGVSILQDILRYHEVPEAEREEVVKFFFRLHPQYLRESLKKPDCNSVSCSQIQDALNWLVEEVNMMDGSAYVGLLTGNSRANALLKISAAGLPTDISNLSISSFGDENDSCTLLIREVMRKIEAKHGMPVDSSDIILIGDTPLDIECAQSTGCQVVAVATGNYEKQIFTSLNPVFVCEDLTQSKDVLSGVTKSEP